MRWGRRGLRSHGGQPASLEGHTAQYQQGGGREGVAAGRLSSDPGSARKELGHLEHAVSLPWPPPLYPSSGSARPVLTQRCVLIVHGSGSDLPSDIPVSKCSDKSRRSQTLAGVGAAGLRHPRTICLRTRCKQALCGPRQRQARQRGLLFLLVDASLQAFGLSANNNSSGTLYDSALQNLLGDRSRTGQA